MTKPGYKTTEIGEIPEEWKVAKLKDISLISAGNTAPQLKKYFEEGKYPFIRMQHLNELETQKYPLHYALVNDVAVSELKLKKFTKGAIIFPKSGESIRTEKRAILKNDSFVVNHLAIIEPTLQKISNLFLFFYLTTIKMGSYLTQTTMPSLNLSVIQSFIIPLPPLSEQQKIAEILSTADEAIQRVNDQLAQTERLKKGLMQPLLTKGIGHTKFKMTEIGEISEEWGIQSFSDSCSRITDGSHYSPQEVKGGTRLIATVFNMGNNKIITETCKRISNKDYELLVKNGCKPDKGDVLFSKDGTVGICFPYFQEDNLVLLSSIAILKPSDVLNSTFLSYFLKSENGMRQIIGLKTGSALKRITLKNLKLVKIPMPSYKEQQKIAEILTTVDHKLERLRNKKAHLEELKRGLMGDLLTGKVRVKINTSKGEN